MPRLLIISDTKIQKVGDSYLGFNSVVLELNVFIELFNKITWIGSDYSEYNKDSALLEIPKSTKVIALPIIGGKQLFHKLESFFKALFYVRQIIKEIPNSDVIHVRGPNAVMFIALLIAPFYQNKKWWFKYANNWIDAKPPFFWGFQKKLMRYYTFSVCTVNGQWDGEPDHIKAFQNPCITMDLVREPMIQKIQSPFNLLFVGRIEFEKGIGVIIEGLSLLNIEQKKRIQKVTFIGNGKDFDFLKKVEIDLLEIEILGECSKNEVLAKMLESTFIMLPTTASEGFPKVIAEAWSQGCIPITSNVSSISQVVSNGRNGFVADVNELQQEFNKALINSLFLTTDQIREMQIEARANLELFTYETYQQRIISEIIH